MTSAGTGGSRFRQAAIHTWKGAPALLAGSALGVAQPTLDLLGRNPTFFVAHRLGPAAIVTFAVAVVVVVPALCLALVMVGHVVSHRLGSTVRSVLVGVMGALAAATALEWAGLGSTAGFALLAAAVGTAVAAGERWWPPVRTALGYMAVAPVLFLALFLLASPTSALLGSAESALPGSVSVDQRPPVVILVLDELPLTTLLDAQGSINARRFPRMAELAQRATWYRNATSVADLSPDSVPSLLSGMMPAPDSVPTVHDYPDNLFTLLGGAYELAAHEPITQLCPASLCRQPTTGTVDRLAGALQDAAVVLGHRVLPPGWRQSLPPVDQSWGGFTDLGQAPPRPERGEYHAEVFELVSSGVPPALQHQGTAEAITSLEPGAGRLWFHHALVPHWPWELTPRGRPYRATPEGFEHPRWTEDTEAIRRMYQRHVMQVGAADLLVGGLIDRLDATGTWDEAMVVVTSDHGAAFQPGLSRRAGLAETLVENFAVPLFVKYPGQAEGGVDDGNALLIDVAPTVLDVLGADLDGLDLDGRSLLAGGPERAEKPLRASGDPTITSMPSSVDALLATAARLRQMTPGGEDWWGLVAHGRGQDSVVGRRVEDLGVGTPVVGHWDEPASVPVALDQEVPVVLDTFMELAGDLPPEVEVEVAVAVNGTVAGVGRLQPGHGPRRLALVLAPMAFVEGENLVEVYVVQRQPELRLLPVDGGRA